jgi:beta-glucosidase
MLRYVRRNPMRFDAGSGFVVATGIECSAPVVHPGVRRDQLLLTGHWDRVEEDLDLVARFGIRYLRYGIPFHVVAAVPGTHDWAWTDRAMGALRDRRIEPIADLLHFGLPSDLTGFGDPALPARFAAYVEAFVERYPWVRWYTPVNEPFITAWYSARKGFWNERQSTDEAFVKALANVSRCLVQASGTIRARRSDAVFLQSDVCWSHEAAEPGAEDRARFLDELRFVAFQLAYGHPVPDSVAAYLVANGLPAGDLDWFREAGSDAGCIVGLDYYEGNEQLVWNDGRQEARTDRRGFGALAREYHAALRLPFMLAETNTVEDRSIDWLTETWNDTLDLHAEGLPVRGYCWYSLTDQVDWSTMLVGLDGNVDPLGLVDLDRVHRPVGHVYERLAQEARRGRLERLGDRDSDAAA